MKKLIQTCLLDKLNNKVETKSVKPEIETKTVKFKLEKKAPQRFEENPYTKDLIINLHSKKKTVQISADEGRNNVLFNQVTGEVRGTQITSYRKVDTEQFVKIFAGGVSSIFDLTSAGNKALCLLFHVTQRYATNVDIVPVDAEEIEKFNKFTKKKLTMSTVMRGIKELIKIQIVARAKRRGHYFINPNYIFNGNRLTFVQTFIRERTDAERELYEARERLSRLRFDSFESGNKIADRLAEIHTLEQEINEEKIKLQEKQSCETVVSSEDEVEDYDTQVL